MSSQVTDRTRGPRPLDRLVWRLRRMRRRGRRGLGSQPALTAALLGLTLVATAGVQLQRPWVPPSVYLLIELLGAFLLRLRGAVVLCVAVLVELTGLQVLGSADLTPGTVVVQAIAVVALLAFMAHRERLGLQGAPGDLMLVDLRDRLTAHGRIPPLPPGWRVETALRSAHAEAFSGDFLVTAAHRGTGLLEILLVDVSGKGQDAGVRSLQLSGALAGLLGSMPSAQFLTSANHYLLENAWDEGFATAVHLTVELATGDFVVASAGHPSPVHVHAGSGLVELLDTVGGPVLGVVESPEFPRCTGRIEPGDVLLLYTDGLVELPGNDVELGIDRLMGVAEQILSTGRGGADAVLAGVRAGEGDDRALVLVHRD